MNWKLSDFDYDLPKSLIAQYPLPERTGSRLLQLDRQTGAIVHGQFKDLLQLLKPNDLLVFNNTKVMRARLFGSKETGGKIEVLVERVIGATEVLAHVRASKALKVGQMLSFGEGASASVLGRQDALYRLQFNQGVMNLLDEIGHIPLPPYMERADEPLDEERYQTVYAKEKGAVAAPTAGLHFDQFMINALKEMGVDLAYLTLHVGAGTFQPVRVENIRDHHMHAEYIDVPSSVCDQIVACRARKGRVIAVGTTTARSLETAALSGVLKPTIGDTDIFITPGFKFQAIDGLITNFHLPQSTLLMLVAALTGLEPILEAYRQAVAERYRFFSYGDAMIIV